MSQTTHNDMDAAAFSPPQGWAAIAETDGVLRVVRPRRTLAKALEDVGLGLIVIGVLLGLTVLRVVPRMLERGDRIGLVFVGLVTTVIVGAAIGGAFLPVIAVEEWRVERDLLELRRCAFGLTWKRRYQGATLAIQGIQAGHLLEERLVLKVGGKQVGLTDFRGPSGSEEARAMGAMVARVTGWPLS